MKSLIQNILFAALLLSASLLHAAIMVASGPIIHGAGGGGGGTPAFGAETQQWNDSGSGSSDVITLTTAVASGKRLVIEFMGSDDTLTVSSATDSKGNTWTVHTSAAIRTSKPTGKIYGAILSAQITTSLTTSDTVTINYATVSGYCSKQARFQTLDNVTAFDAAAANSESSSQSSSATVSLGVLVANTVTVGFVFENQDDLASSPSWTAIGKLRTDANSSFAFQNTYSTSGTKIMSCTLSDTCWWAACAVSFK